MRCLNFLVVTAIIFGATLTSCDKNENSVEDGVYPTTIYRLSEETLSRKRNEFAQRNPYVSSTLNQFGFCALGEPRSVAAPPAGSFTEEEAIAAVKEFVVRNQEYTGVSNPYDFDFRVIQRDELTNGWLFRARNQIMNNIEIEYTEFIFHVRNRTVTYCHGNHFSKVYVPKKFIFDIEQAKSQLLGREITRWGWSGPYTVGPVTAEHLQESSEKLIILPLSDTVEYSDAEKIELRVAWKIYVEALHHIFEVDVMTGEIIREIPTIIH